MRRILFACVFIFIASGAYSQITITASDMPVMGDTLRYSNVNPMNTGINTGITGGGLAWNYVFNPLSQAVDTYQAATAINPLYAITVGATAYGYKIADSIPGLGAVLPVSIQELYDFFDLKSGPDRYEAKAFGASVAGFPAAANYAPADVWYFLPLAYGHADSTPYALNFSLATLGALKEQGYRKTIVDGWGTIQTPFYTVPVPCLRVRSEVHEIDSVTFMGTSIGFPRNTVEFKWMVNGDHYPALWVTDNVILGQEITTSVKYRDKYVDSLNPHDSVAVTGIKTTQHQSEHIIAYPVPAIDGAVTLAIPASWQGFVVEVFDVNGNEVACFKNERRLDIATLSAGQYIVRISSGEKLALARIEK